MKGLENFGLEKLLRAQSSVGCFVGALNIWMLEYMNVGYINVGYMNVGIYECWLYECCIYACWLYECWDMWVLDLWILEYMNAEFCCDNGSLTCKILEVVLRVPYRLCCGLLIISIKILWSWSARAEELTVINNRPALPKWNLCFNGIINSGAEKLVVFRKRPASLRIRSLEVFPWGQHTEAVVQRRPTLYLRWQLKLIKCKSLLSGLKVCDHGEPLRFDTVGGQERLWWWCSLSCTRRPGI